MGLPSDAPAIGYIDVAALRKLQNSSLAAVWESATNDQVADKEYAAFVRDTGFDYARDLDEAAIAVWPSGLDAAANAAGDNPALAIADGRFDQKKIEAHAVRAGGRTEQRGSQTLYIVPGRPTVSFEFFSPSRIVIASGKKSVGLLSLVGTAGANDEMKRRVQKPSGVPIFANIRTSNLPQSFYANFSNYRQLDGLIRSIREISLAGQPLSDSIHVSLDAQCDSTKNALEISALLDGFRYIGSMALTDPKTQRQLTITPEQATFLAHIVKGAEISHGDRWVRINLDITAKPSI